MRPVSAKTQAIRDLLEKNPNVTYSEAKDDLVQAGHFVGSEADESYFNNVKSQYLKRLAIQKESKSKAKQASTRLRVARMPVNHEVSLMDAIALISANGGSVTAVRDLISQLTAAVEVVQTHSSVLSKLVS